MKFDEFEFKEYIVRALQDLKFKELMPVQKEVLQAIVQKKNILAKSKTGRDRKSVV